MLLVTLPLFVVIAAAIRLDDHGPVFFRQTRGARWGAPFTMLKFRTMGVDAEQRLDELLDLERLADPMFKLKEDPRVTRVGRFLRRTSLDELPQLINVLTGTMSIVGPRPEDYRLVQRYDADALAVRCGMKPGITGPMQVHGRGDLTFAERIAVEREYLENYTVTNDLRILAMTVASLLFGSGGAY
jgi:lipopolysaccharide/colanic/teichoic acid biosynthesis glycosyltransferase